MNLMRIRYLLNAGLLLLMAGLFGTAVVLNRNHFTSANANVEIAFERELRLQVRHLRKELEQQEDELFARAEQPLILDEASSVADFPEHFLILPNGVVPACTAGLAETVSDKEAKEAFRSGLAALPDKAALPHFKTAAQLKVKTADDLYRKIGAWFNVLEFERDVRSVCCLLTLIHQSSPALTESQRLFFNDMLGAQVPNLEQIAAWLKQQEATAERIDQYLTRQKGAYRTTINERTLSVREDGRAVLYPPRLETAPPVELIRSADETAGMEIAPGLYATIPKATVAEAQRNIRRQYRTGNTIMALMALLGAGLLAGMAASAQRRQKLNALRTQFIATVSHELRTPLSLIRLHAETLHHGRIPPEKVAEYHQTILTESERLSGIVNNVLDFSRMERGKLTIHLETVNLSDCTGQIIESFASRFETEGFKVEQRIKPDIISRTDPLAFSQILFNLLDNAIKYSDGTKIIEIGLDVSKGWNILTVADQGIGIPDKLKKPIFDEFTRSDDSKVTARRGSGIGLNVAQRLAEKMGGTIEVADNRPKGTVFTVRLKERNETTGG